MSEELSFDGLPELLAFFAESAGLAAALKLAEAFGGLDIYLPAPENLTQDHRLVKALGGEAAFILCRDWGPGEVAIPLAYHSLKTKKAAIAKMVEEPYSDAVIARKVGTTVRHVRRVRRELGVKNSLQRDLFDLFPEDDGPG